MKSPDHDGPSPRQGRGRVSSEGLGYRVVLRVDGKELPLKEFLHDLIGGATVGMIEALEGAKSPRRIDLSIDVLDRTP